MRSTLSKSAAGLAAVGVALALGTSPAHGVAIRYAWAVPAEQNERLNPGDFYANLSGAAGYAQGTLNDSLVFTAGTAGDSTLSHEQSAPGWNHVTIDHTPYENTGTSYCYWDSNIGSLDGTVPLNCSAFTNNTTPDQPSPATTPTSLTPVGSGLSPESTATHGEQAQTTPIPAQDTEPSVGTRQAPSGGELDNLGISEPDSVEELGSVDGFTYWETRSSEQICLVTAQEDSETRGASCVDPEVFDERGLAGSLATADDTAPAGYLIPEDADTATSEHSSDALRTSNMSSNFILDFDSNERNRGTSETPTNPYSTGSNTQPSLTINSIEGTEYNFPQL